jgi:hypothetical protein
MLSAEPVENDASSEAKKSAAAAISSGWPNLPIGYFESLACFFASVSSVLRRSCIRGVNVVPGFIQFTLILWAAMTCPLKIVPRYKLDFL